MQQKIYLEKRLNEEPHEKYPAASRIHALKTFPRCFVKRDDELGFSISGTKFRKYRTLIPYLRKHHEVVVTGGPFSNHVLAMTQLLIENGIKPILFLKGPPPDKTCGNFLFLKMLIPSSSIHWDEDYPNGGMILPEGGSLFQGFLGALTLPLDIVRNENEMGFAFDHVFIEAGTGYSAAALLLGFAYLKKKTACHVLLLADTEEKFRSTLSLLHKEFEEWLKETIPFPNNFTCSSSSIAPSFGATNRAVFNFIAQIARTEGFFLDPIYSAKLFYHAKERASQLGGNILIIHSGGALTLAGFQPQLSKVQGD